jgi:hypothetical protein
MKNKVIERPNNLKPLGIRSTVSENYNFNETFIHIFNEIKKISKS